MMDTGFSNELSEVKQDIVRLETQLDNMATQLERAMATTEKALEQQAAQLAKINEVLAEARGSWKVLVLLGGSAATAGAALWSMIQPLLHRN